jgi:hypothetical protein
MTRHHASYATDSRTGTIPPQPVSRPTGSPFVNISPAERTGRILIGIFGIVAGIVLLLAAGSAIAVTLEILLVAAGLDMLVTGARGHCPLYARLGHVPPSQRGTR